MSHHSPRVFEILSIHRLSVLADHEAWRGALDGQVDDGGVIGHGFDGVASTVGGKLHGDVVGVEGAFVVGKVGVAELVGTPEVWEGLVWIEDLGVELCGCVDSAMKVLAGVLSYSVSREWHVHNVGVDNLSEADVALLGHEVETEGLNRGRVHGVPFHVIVGELGVRGCLGLLGDRADVGWAIDWLLGAGDIGQPM